MRNPHRRRQAVWLGALCVGLPALILLMNWPWPRHFAGGFAHHFDPPFHAWKLTLVARHIRQGHILPPDGNTNCFFPSSRTLYYEALHWPQALVAAGLMAFTDNPVLIYHLVLLLFWAASGLAMAGLLRELGAGRPAAALGAVLFCIIPYRVSYFVEFNMQLVVGLVLFLLCGVRFFRRPGFRNGLGLGMAFWLQATSELYQAIILVLAAPLIFLPLLVARRPRFFLDRRFCRGVAGFLLAVALTYPFVSGYRELHRRESFARGRQEMAFHCLEPASYLLTPGGRALTPGIRIRHDEMSVYPTLAVLAAAAFYAWRRRGRAAAAAPSAAGPWPRLGAATRRLRAVAMSAFVLLVLWLEYAPGVPSAGCGVLLNAVIRLSLAACAVAAFFPVRRDDTGRFLAGLGAAAAACFVLSFGPTIIFAQNEWKTANRFFNDVYEAFPFLLGAMRVVSRFSVVVMVYLVTTAALGWEEWAARRSRRLAGLSAAAMVAAVMLESRPWGRRFDDFDWRPRSPALAALAPPESSTLLVLPFGERFHDSRHMLAIGRHDRLMLYGWGGFYPQFQHRLAVAYRENDHDRLAALIAEVWPATDVLVRHDVPSTPLAPGPRRCREAEIEGLAPHFATVAEDESFTLLRLRPDTGALVSRARQTRADFLRRNPRVIFTARADDAAPLRLVVLVNGAWFGEAELSGEQRSFSFVVPRSWRNDIQPNRVQLRSFDDRPWLAERFEFMPASGFLPPATAEVASALPRADDWPAWMSHTLAPPSAAVPSPIVFRNGLRLISCAPGRIEARRGESLCLRFHWTCDPARPAEGRPVHFVHALRDGAIRFQDDHVVFADIDRTEVHVQPYPKIYTTESLLHVPGDAPAGDYELWTGLHDLSHQRRVPATSRLPARRAAFRLPVKLTVVE